jgi:flagellar basal body rod protein FlgC
LKEEAENTELNQIPTPKPEKKRFRIKKVISFIYLAILHLLAAGAMFGIFTALAVHFKWTNNAGSVDLNSRYFSKMADKYNQGFKTDSMSVVKNEYIMFRQIGILTKYSPNNAKTILENYHNTGNVEVALRMLDAVNLCMIKNRAYQKEISQIKWDKNDKTLSVFAWSNYNEWKQFCKVVKADKHAIDSVSALTGVESRMIVMCLVGEQVRMFNSGREKFKKYVTPFNRLILPKNRGYGVTGILQHTAIRIEQNLYDKSSPFYAGDYYQKCLNVKDSFPELVNDTIEAHKNIIIQRLIKGGDHFYSYLYTAFFLRQFQTHWERAGFTLSNRPEILGTLFNLGYQKSKPKKNPSVGGSNFIVGDKEYTFGGLCYEFYYSGELQDLFPLTGKGFIPLKEVMENNKALDEVIKNRIKKEEERVKIDSGNL